MLAAGGAHQVVMPRGGSMTTATTSGNMIGTGDARGVRRDIGLEMPVPVAAGVARVTVTAAGS